MKDIGAGLKAHLNSTVTTLATCWRCELLSGDVFGFTTHVEDLLIDGVTYESDTAFTPTNVQLSSALNVDNLNIAGVLDSPSLVEDDLFTGKWDFCKVEIFIVNYLDLNAGIVNLLTTRIGEVRSGRTMFEAELRGMMQAFSKRIGELRSPLCRVRELGDERCKVDLAPYTHDSEVSGGLTGNRAFNAPLELPDGYFDNGKLTFTSGANEGLSMEIKRYIVGFIELQQPMPYVTAVADTFTAIAGCNRTLIKNADGTYSGDCKLKFNNVVNFRGEPTIPGLNKLIRGPR